MACIMRGLLHVQGSFPSLQYMMLGNTGLSGQLPTGWGSQLSFPSIKVMDLSSNILQGVCRLMRACQCTSSGSLAA